MSEIIARLSSALADRYSIERELGAGGMATVYLAEDVRHKRKVAVKVLRPELAAVVGADRFLHEIEVTAALQHPHILPLFASGEADSLVYYVMPYVEGDSLRDRLQREEPLSFGEVATILREVADALAYAHSRGVLHRDIKPDNIMLSGGHATVMDFGVSRAVSTATDHAALTTAGLAIGTPAYMAPEQAAADPEIDHRADIYAWGVLGYELLTGTTPFEGRAPHQILAAHMTEAPEAVSSRRPGVPPGLADAVMRALEKEIDDRWASGEEIVASLAAVDEAESPRRPAEKAPPVRVVASIFGIVALIALVFMIFGPDREPASDDTSTLIVVFPFRVGGDAELEYLREGMATWLGRGLDGAGDLRSVDPHAVIAAVQDRDVEALGPNRLSEIANAFDADFYVAGEVGQAGSQVRIDATLYSQRAGAEPQHATVTGTPDEILGMVDNIASQILVSGAIPASRVTQAAGGSTPSLAAFKAFLEGEQHFRGGRYDQAVDAFQRAIVADTEFALAQYRLSISAEYVNRSTLAEEAVSAARRNADRLSVHDAQLLEALILTREGNDVRAEQVLRGIVAQWQQDVEAWFQLGEIDFHYGPLRGRPLEASAEAFERVLRLDPDHTQSLEHVQRIAAHLGDAVAVDTLGHRIYELIPGTRRALTPEIIRAVVLQDSVDLARLLLRYRAFPELVAPGEPTTFMAWTDEFAAAELFLAVMTESNRSPQLRALGHVYRANIRAVHGRLGDARTEFAATASFDSSLAIAHHATLELGPLGVTSIAELEALRRDLQAWDAAATPPSALAGGWYNVHDGLYPFIRLHMLGVTNARLGRVDEAIESQRALRAVVDDVSSGIREAMALSIDAHIALERSDSTAALAALERQPLIGYYQSAMFSPVRSRINDRFLRAVLLEAVGREADATALYDSFANFGPHDIVLMAPGHMALGRIAERQGRSNDARAHYERVLFLWSDADPELQPLVAEAAEALRRIG